MDKKIILNVVITILFLCSAIVPNINGNINKKNVHLANNIPAKFNLEDDYINAFWKFDECSGDTVGDSSSHNYDGSRNGATWTSYGYSGCALEFDGIDDFVNFTNHVTEIAANKTDDFNISFYFNSTGDGIIFSATSTLYYSPDIRIELLSNGSILFRIGKETCDIQLFSDEGYNNGQWHYVEIIFKGITTDPTEEIYIDHNLDASKTDWICDFENIDFIATAIGKKASENSGFFKGLIDEFKFIKYEGGNEQVPPEISGPTFGEVGVEYEYTFTIYDPEGDKICLKIDWDDGNITDWLGPYEFGEPVNKSHKWDEEGRYDIKAKSKDFWGESWWNEYPVRIGDFLEPPTIYGPKFGDAGEELTYTFVAEDTGGGDLLYYIDWGDGNYTGWIGPYPSGENVTISHIWYENGTYAILAKVGDIHGRESGWSYPYYVKIGDFETLEIIIDGPTRGRPNIIYYYNFSIKGYDGESIRLVIDWGDWTYQFVVFEAGKNVTVGHSWNQKGSYIIRVRAIDEFGFWFAEGELKVVIPRVRFSVTSFLFKFLEKFEFMCFLKNFFKIL